MRDTIDMAREAGFTEGELAFMGDNFRRLVDLVRADEQEKYKWDIHSCGPTCKRYACVAMREAVETEREACAKTKAGKPRELKPVGRGTLLGEQQFCFDKGWREGAASVRAAIRNRGNI
jgi:hypothetical protein